MSAIWSSPSTLDNLHPLVPPHIFTSSFRGPTATAFLQWLTPSSLASLPPYTSTLSVLLNPSGGIIDDTIITKHSDTAYYVVTNAGRRERDLAWFKEKLEEWNKSEQAQREGVVEHELLDGWGLLALQGIVLHYVVSSGPFLSIIPITGPEAAQYLQGLTSFDLKELTFGKSAFVPIEGFNVHVARGGYTGEDGFEVCCVLAVAVPPPIDYYTWHRFQYLHHKRSIWQPFYQNVPFS